MNFYPLYSGSTGNCSLIESDNVKILVDAGVTGKAAEAALAECRIDPHDLSAILISHEHSDHYKGAGVLSRKYGLPVYANEKTWGALRDKIGRIDEKYVRTFETDREFCIEDVEILPFAIPHDTVDPVAFTFISGDRKVAVATDIGHITKRVEEVLNGSDLLLIESNHDIEMLKAGSYSAQLKRRILSNHGHLSNESCGKLLCRLYRKGVKRAILGHLSLENNTEKTACSCVSALLAEEGIGADYMLKTAHHDRVCGKFEV